MTGLLDVMSLGAARVKELDDPILLKQWVEALLSIYRMQFTGYSICAATPQSERLLGAAMMLDSTLRVDAADNAMIVGVNIASGTQISRAAVRLREAGTRGKLVAVALNAILPEWRSGAPGWSVPEVDELIILEAERTSPSSFG
ncbi:hypothetical protein [Nocardia sp. NPDC023988]|uniref:hypothetical protein n=1 Tax=unclassified Nocardia TaxID=2637762 RepID=UPI0033C72442